MHGTVISHPYFSFIACLGAADDNDLVTSIIESSTNSEVDLIVEKLKSRKITPYVLFNAKNQKQIEMVSLVMNIPLLK